MRISKTVSNKRSARVGQLGAGILSASLLAVAILLGLSTAVRVAQAGKPAAPPPTPPVYYDVNLLGSGAAIDMNEYGVMVGTSTGGGVPGFATMYYLGSGGAINLNTGASLIDLDTANPAAPIASTDWIAARATGINLLGEIVGIANNSAGTTRAFHYDPNTSLIKLLPGPIFWNSNYFGPRINDLGVICTTDGGYGVVVYTLEGASYSRVNLSDPTIKYVKINNAGVIAGWSNALDPTAFRILPIGSDYTNAVIDRFPGYRFYGISDGAGSVPAKICGDKLSGTPKTRGPVRLNATGAASIQLLMSNGAGWATDVNDFGDVIINNAEVLLKDGSQLSINNLIAPEDKEWWNANPNRVYWSVSNRDSTGFGMIGLYTQFTNQVILLTPRTPPSP